MSIFLDQEGKNANNQSICLRDFMPEVLHEIYASFLFCSLHPLSLHAVLLVPLCHYLDAAVGKGALGRSWGMVGCCSVRLPLKAGGDCVVGSGNIYVEIVSTKSLHKTANFYLRNAHTVPIEARSEESGRIKNCKENYQRKINNGVKKFCFPKVIQVHGDINLLLFLLFHLLLLLDLLFFFFSVHLHHRRSVFLSGFNAETRKEKAF